MINYPRMYKGHGFTLIELLIAITILSLLLLTGSYTYSIMSERWNKELGYFSSTSQQAKSITLTQRLLEGIHSYVVVDEQRKPAFFFIGHQDSLLAVSKAGYFSGNYSEVFRLTVVKKENGLFDLLYQSKNTENFLLKGTSQTITFDRKIRLFTDLDQIEFEYYGWRHMFEKTDDEKNDFKRAWQTSYSGIDSQYMPEVVKLNLTKENATISLRANLQTDVESWLTPYFERDS